MWSIVFAWVTGFTLMFASFQIDSWLRWMCFYLALWFFVAGFVQAWVKSRE